jgi:hypothetical protein
MNHSEILNKWVLAAVLLSLGSACSASVDDSAEMADEGVGQVTEAIWESGCNSHASDSFGSGTFAFETAATYEKVDPVCSKTWIARVSSFDKTSFDGVAVTDWATDITSKSVCNTLWMAAQLFRLDGSTWTPVTADTDLNYRHNGMWNTVLPGYPKCLNAVFFDESLFESGRTYRMHATARTSRYGSTRKMYFIKDTN